MLGFCCCHSVTKSYLILCNPMDCRTSGYLSFTISQNLLKLVHWVDDAIQPSYPLLSLSPAAFSPSQHQDESALFIRWPKYWSFSFSISPSNEYSGLISFRIDWFDPLAVQGTLKNLLLEVDIFTHKFNIQSCTTRCVIFNFQD